MSQTKYVTGNLLYIDQNIKFKLILGIYQNIITFFNDNDISFLTEMKLDFSQIPNNYHGNGISTNLIEYLSNNTNDSNLTYSFLNYFLFSIIKIKCDYKDKIIFNFMNSSIWSNMSLQIYIPAVSTSTTTITTLTSSTTTTAIPTTTTTTTTLRSGLLTLGFNDINNLSGIVDINSVDAWNTYFNLPTNGVEFQSVTVDGNNIDLYGGSNITLNDNLFIPMSSSLVSIVSGDIIHTGINVFGNFMKSCIYLTTVNLPNLINAGNSCFYNCTSLINLNLPNVQNIGDDGLSNCTALLSINLPSLISATSSSLSNCESAISFDMPLLQTAGDYCFYGNSSAITYNLPNLQVAGDYCFSINPILTNIYLPSLLSGGTGIFSNNYGSDLININLPSLISIGNLAFYKDTVLETIDMPNCINLGSTVGNDNCFNDVQGLTTGSTLSLTVSNVLQSCNDGLPDGDIQYLTGLNISIGGYGHYLGNLANITVNYIN